MRYLVNGEGISNLYRFQNEPNPLRKYHGTFHAKNVPKKYNCTSLHISVVLFKVDQSSCVCSHHDDLLFLSSLLLYLQPPPPINTSIGGLLASVISHITLDCFVYICRRAIFSTHTSKKQTKKPKACLDQMVRFLLVFPQPAGQRVAVNNFVLFV